MINIFDKNNYRVTPEDLNAADKSASDLENQLYQQYHDMPINSPVLSPYGIYWKIMNRLDGFS